MGIKYQNAVISAHSFSSSLIAGPRRNGAPEREARIISDQVIALLDFDPGVRQIGYGLGSPLYTINYFLLVFNDIIMFSMNYKLI